MSKIIPFKPFGVPVNADIPVANHIVAYYGPHPLTPSYSQAARIDAGPISGLSTVKDSAGASEWSIDLSSKLPEGLSGSYDFVFTDMDGNTDESDFSPSVTVIVDTLVPLALGQPVVLG